MWTFFHTPTFFSLVICKILFSGYVSSCSYGYIDAPGVPVHTGYGDKYDENTPVRTSTKRQLDAVLFSTYNRYTNTNRGYGRMHQTHTYPVESLPRRRFRADFDVRFTCGSGPFSLPSPPTSLLTYRRSVILVDIPIR